VLVLTRVLPAQDNASSKIPEGEAQFTHEQLAQYYVVYKNSDVRYLRSLFDGYLNSSGGTEQERQALSKWDKAYFRSKFVVMSRDVNTFGGTLMTILFQDRPDKVFVRGFIQTEATRSWHFENWKHVILAKKTFDESTFATKSSSWTKFTRCSASSR
jgi:hypothetical protein